MTRIEKMIKDGYPKIIKGNGGYRTYLKDMQPLAGSIPAISFIYKAFQVLYYQFNVFNL